MAESYLTTDIIVIIVLVVVLVFVGVGAFIVHFYWTKIGVADMWNTTKWSSMRSSFYRTIRRFSRGHNSKLGFEQPLSNPSTYSNDIDDMISPDPIDNKKLSPMITSYIKPSINNLNKPVSMIEYNNSVYPNYATKIGQPIENTKISNIYEYNNRYSDPTPIIEKQRF